MLIYVCCLTPKILRPTLANLKIAKGEREKKKIYQKPRGKLYVAGAIESSLQGITLRCIPTVLGLSIAPLWI